MNQLKKNIAILSMIVMVASIFLPSLALAEDSAPLADGQYTIDFTVLKNGTNEPSTMEDYTVRPAKLTVEGGKNYVTVTLENSSWISVFETNGTNSSVTSDVYSDEEANTRDVQFEVYDLSQKVEAYTEVSVPDIGYSGEYEVQFQFDPASISSDGPTDPADPDDPAEPTDPDDPTEPTNPDDPTEPTDPVDHGLAEGEYTIEFSALRADNDNPSSMNERFDKPGTLKVENGKLYLSIVLSNSQYITGLELQRADGTWVAYNTDFRVTDFEVADLSAPIQAKVSMRVPTEDGIYENTQPFRIVLDKESVAVVPAEPALADGEYTIEFSALRADNDNPSSMNERFDKPGALKVENGKKYLSLVLSNSQYITGLELQRADGTWVAYNTDFRVTDFEVADLSAPIQAKVSMRVPTEDGIYENTQPFRIVLNKDSVAKTKTVTLDEDGTVALSNIDFRTVVETNYEGKPLRIAVPAGSSSLAISEFDSRPDSLLIHITVGGLGDRTVTLTLPKPSDLPAEQVGAFHQNGDIWEYREAAVNGDQVVFETNLSAVKLAQKVAVPENVTATVAANQVTVQWNAVADAQYELVRIQDGAETVISNLTGVSYTDTVSYSSNYTYKVRAIVNGHQSAWSAGTNASTGAAPGGGGGPAAGIKPDGTYTIDYRILKDGTSQTSVMQQYVERPAELTISGGAYYVSMTLKNSSWVPVFEVTGNGGPASDASHDEAADRRVVRFQVYDLTKNVDVYTEADVPDIDYSGKYNVQIQFDTSSIQAVGSSGQGAATTGAKETSVNGLIGGEASHNGTVIVFPAGAFEGEFVVTIAKWSDPSRLPLKDNMQLIGDVLDITKDKEGKFSKAVTLTLPFHKDLVDLENDEVGLYWFNEDTKEWILLANVQVDAENGKISGETDHFTKFAVIATKQKQSEEELIRKEDEKEEETKVTLFTDIRGHWAQSSIQRLYALGAVSGYEDRQFRPDQPITRAEFAAMIVQTFQLEEDSSRVFADTEHHWAKPFIARASAAGIVTGYNEQSFGPDDHITREQMAVIIARAIHLQADESAVAHRDEEAVEPWALQAVKMAGANGLMAGYPDQTFQPKGIVTRAEAATVIVRALKFK